MEPFSREHQVLDDKLKSKEKEMIGRMFFIVLILFSGYCHAGLVDKRSKPGQTSIEVNYKRVTLEDLTLGIVPTEYRVEFSPQTIKTLKVTVVGKAPWDTLLNDAIAQHQLESVVDQEKRVVRIHLTVSEQSGTARFSKLESRENQFVPVATFETKNSDGLISTTIANWAQKANMQLVWEPEDVDYPVQAENVWGSDIRSAINGLFGSLAGARTPLRACIHPNQPREVLRIIRAGDACTNGNGVN